MTSLEQAFERFYLRDHDPNSPITKDALLRGADGQYFHQHMRTYLAYFEGGAEYALTVAADVVGEVTGQDLDGWGASMDLLNREEEAPAPAAEPLKADPYCWDCNGAGDGKGGQCPTCWTHPF